MGCPDENVLVSFAVGELDAATHALVVAHIDACPDCNAMVADAAQAVGEPTNTEPTHVVTPVVGGQVAPPLPGPLPRGTTMGRYVVLDLLGSGGLGHVYTAYDPELDRRVAIKLLRPSSSGTAEPEAQRWLMREAQAMAQLSHPNVVPVHDIGTFGEQVFIAMKLVGGGTLRTWLQQGSRSWREIRDVLVEAGRGLAAAHDAGLVHRDFKPANLLIDDDRRPYVVDFGLARAVAGPAAGAPEIDPLILSGDAWLDADLTATGVVIGTPAYMAPEQFNRAEVDPRADQFAFCVTLYEALYGTRPFSGRSYAELKRAIEVGGRVPTASAVPTWLGRVVMRGLSAARDDRYPAMAELLHALTADRRSRRRQRAWLGAAVLATAAVAGTVGFVLRPAPSAAEQDAVEALVSAAREAAARAYFIYPPDDDPSYETAYVRVLELEAMQDSSAAREQASMLRDEFATTLVRLGDAYWEREGGVPFASDYYAAALVFDPSQAHAAERIVLTPGQLGALAQRAADLAFSRGELVAAQALIALAEPDTDRRRAKIDAFSKRGVGPVATHTQLSRLVGEADRPPVASRKIEDPEPSDEAMAATSPRPEARHTSKAPPAKHAPDVRPANTSAPDVKATPRDPKAAKTDVALGKAALKRGRAKDAAAHFHRALEHDPRSVAALAGLARVHFELVQYSRAVDFGERAIRLAPKRADLRLELGDSYVNVLRYADARKQYLKAQAMGASRAQARLDQLDKKQQR